FTHFVPQHAKTIGSCRPSSDIPEFRYILRTEENGLVLPEGPGNGIGSLGDKGLGGLCKAREKVRVNREGHQSFWSSYIDSRLTAWSERGGVGRCPEAHASNAAARSSGDSVFC